jgi:hypothetical protein
VANPDDRGQAESSADTEGQGFVRIDGRYLAEALKACGGMIDFSLASASSPMLFSLDGYRLVVMPMLTEKAQVEAKAKAEQAKAESTTEPVAEPADKPKGKRRAKQPITA